MLLKLKCLKIKGIGRFLEEQTILFDALGRFVQLGGLNNNTKGSSGAGKSTVFMALDYLFGVSDRPSTVLKCRYSPDDPIIIDALFEYNGKDLRIIRGKKLSIQYGNDDPVIGSSSITEEELDKIIGMDRKLFRKLYHKRQKEGGFFLKMAPKEMNDFMTGALGHNTTKKSLEIIEKRLTEIVKLKIVRDTDLNAAKAALNATEEALSAFGTPPARDMDQATVLDMKKKADNSQSALAQLIATLRFEEETLNLSRPSIVSMSFDRSQIEKLEKEHSEISKQISEIQETENSRAHRAQLLTSELSNKLSKLLDCKEKGERATKQAIEVAAQLKKIKEGKCYTCGHDWIDIESEASLRDSVKNLRGMIEAGRLASEQIEATRAMKEDAAEKALKRPVDTAELTNSRQSTLLSLASERQREKDHQAEDAKRNRARLDEFAVKESELRGRHKALMDQARGQSDLDRRAFELSVSKLRAYDEAKNRYETSLASLQAQVTSYYEKVSKCSELLSLTLDEIDKAEELKRGLKSYLSCSFDDALESISENATSMIRNIPNMANATIQLKGTKEGQDGSVKEEITAVLSMDGEENVDLRSLCGGEETSTDLAIDLSVIDFLENKANKGIDLFILDEPFQGLDTVCIENALEVLRNSHSKKRIVIVDHNPEVKEMVESQLTAVRNGATSIITQTI